MIFVIRLQAFVMIKMLRLNTFEPLKKEKLSGERFIKSYCKILTNLHQIKEK